MIPCSASSVLDEPPYAEARTVVWEDGGGSAASYPIHRRCSLSRQ